MSLDKIKQQQQKRN